MWRISQSDTDEGPCTDEGQGTDKGPGTDMGPTIRCKKMFEKWSQNIYNSPNFNKSLGIKEVVSKII